jgi:hypothetical protein
MYIVTTGMHKMFCVVFHARRINMLMSLNGIEHMYIITDGSHMMV